MNYMVEYVRYLFNKHNIQRIHDLSVEEIADRFGVETFNTTRKSKTVSMDGVTIIFLNQNQTMQKIREDFFHELAHCILDHEIKSTITSFLHTEGKANRLAYYLSIPSQEIYELDYKHDNFIYDMAEVFNVSNEYALNRYMMFCENSEFTTPNTQRYFIDLITKHNANLASV